MTDAKPSNEPDEQQAQEKWYDRTRYQILLFVGGIVLFVLVGGWILDWYINPHTSGQKRDLVQALGLLTAGVAGAVGIFFTWRGQRITQESLQDTRENSEENLHLAREGQIAERFTRAIDQLGATDEGKNKKLEIRLGGIYALERIAWDSLAMETSQGRAYSTVVEVLTAYVRENTTQTPGLHPLRRWLRSTAKPPAPPEPTADIQTILDVLSRTQAHAPEEYRSRLDLREAHLQGANLQQASLLKADLSEAHLQGAKLSGANLQEANLHGAIVTDEQLAATWSLQRATMPDGRKYEDWLKDKQGSGDDVENE